MRVFLKSCGDTPLAKSSIYKLRHNALNGSNAPIQESPVRMKRSKKLKQRVARSLLKSVGIDPGRIVQRPESEQLPGQNHVQDIASLYGVDDVEAAMMLLRMNGKIIASHIAKGALDPTLMADLVEPQPVSSGWRPTTEGDLKSNWCRWWLRELQHPLQMHRKLWEHGWALQELFAAGMLTEGRRGLGFGCGTEPLASYFAKKRVHALITDLDPSQGASEAWAETAQHASSLRAGFFENLVTWDRYQEFVSHRFADMNAISDDLQGFDFCWSICALEHLGSIEAGLQFVENSVKTLRPGGVAVHTTEFNCQDNERTIETGPSVVFRRRDFEELAERLTKSGHRVGTVSFDTGSEFFDQYVDLQPYLLDSRSVAMRDYYGAMTQSGHLRATIGGFVSTCYGLVVQAGESQ